MVRGSVPETVLGGPISLSSVLSCSSKKVQVDDSKITQLKGTLFLYLVEMSGCPPGPLAFEHLYTGDMRAGDFSLSEINIEIKLTLAFLIMHQSASESEHIPEYVPVLSPFSPLITAGLGQCSSLAYTLAPETAISFKSLRTSHISLY